ncbi:MAG: hypothetical protein WC503_01820 [Candidatus Shapirobacteria bacterium]
MITKIRFKFELFFYYIKRNWLYLLSGLILGIILVTFRQQLLSFYLKINRPLEKIGLEGLYTVNNLPNDITNKISYGLTVNTENNKFETSPLVKNLDIRQDNTQYIFELNPDIKWHKGKPFVSSDINYKITGLSITFTDSQHLTIKTEKPFAPILSTLSLPLIKKDFDSLGEYQVDRFDYQDGNIKDLYLKSSDNSILYRFYQNETDLLNAFKIGEVNQIQLSTIPKNFDNWPKIDITKNIRTDQKYIALFINTAKLGNKQLRQALAYATPKTTDLNERTISPISPTSWAYNHKLKTMLLTRKKPKSFFPKIELNQLN